MDDQDGNNLSGLVFDSNEELGGMEKLLRVKLTFRENDLMDVYWEAANFYGGNGQPGEARKYLEKILSVCRSPEKHANTLVSLGQASERMNDIPAAVGYYSQAMAMEPENQTTMYLIHNNLAYLMNLQERYVEAEGICRTAIQINPQRHNAYKNLGVSLEGQGKILEAAQNYLHSAQLNAMDSRALNLLTILYREHPELIGDIPDIEAKIEECREEARIVEGYRKKYQDV